MERERSQGSQPKLARYCDKPREPTDLEKLIDQWSDPFAFVRELVTNAIDADCSRIDFEIDFRPSKNPRLGVWIMHCRDDGRGMNRSDIDSYLCCLTASGHSDAPKKFGKSGIGFLSIFALRPNAVIVLTGRDGESTRVFFQEDRSFSRIPLTDRAVQGTHVQFIKEIEVVYVGPWRERCRRTLEVWCRFSQTPIFFEGSRIKADFPISSPLCRGLSNGRDAPHPRSQSDPLRGLLFYKHGITLYESNEAFFPGLAFRIDNPILHTTLARDNILKDKSYQLSLQALRNAIRERLVPRLFQAPKQSENDELLAFLSFLEPTRQQVRMPLVTTVKGRKISLLAIQRCQAQWGAVYWSHADNSACEIFHASKIPLLLWAGSQIAPGLERLVAARGAKLYPALTDKTPRPAFRTSLIS